MPLLKIVGISNYVLTSALYSILVRVIGEVIHSRPVASQLPSNQYFGDRPHRGATFSSPEPQVGPLRGSDAASVDLERLSDRVEQHGARQSELQHYIKLLLDRSPGSPQSEAGAAAGNHGNPGNQGNQGASPSLSRRREEEEALAEISQLVSHYGGVLPGGGTAEQPLPETNNPQLQGLLQHLRNLQLQERLVPPRDQSQGGFSGSGSPPSARLQTQGRDPPGPPGTPPVSHHPPPVSHHPPRARRSLEGTYKVPTEPQEVQVRLPRSAESPPSQGRPCQQRGGGGGGGHHPGRKATAAEGASKKGSSTAKPPHRPGSKSGAWK